MAFNKIQPEQVQQPTFFGASGDFNIDQSTSTGVGFLLSRNLTGDFNYSGSLTLNTREVFSLGNTGNNFFVVDSGNLLIRGSTTRIGDGVNDGNNICISSDNSTVSGTNNLILNCSNVSFSTGTISNTAVAGNNITFPTQATGCVVLKDNKTTSLSAVMDESLYVGFESGHFFEIGQSHFAENVSMGSSGIISGDLQVIGSGMITGQEVITRHYLTGYASGNLVTRGGDEAITGEKTIESTMRFNTGFQLPLYTGTVQGAGTAEAPATGALAISGHTLYVYVGASAWAGIPISGSL
jgi:hypothetical protein